MNSLATVDYNATTPQLALMVALATATLCLVLAVRLLQRAIEPIGALLQAVLATALTIVVIGVALAAMFAAAFSNW